MNSNDHRILQGLIDALHLSRCWHTPKSAEEWDGYVPPTKISFYKGSVFSETQPNPIFREYREGFMRPTLNEEGQQLFSAIKNFIKSVKLSKTICFIEMSKNIRVEGESK